LRPERVFAERQILLVGTDSMTVLPAESVERIELRSDVLPEWSHAQGVASINEITEEEFRQIQRHDPPVPRKVLGRLMPTPPVEIGMMVDMRSGHATYLSIQFEAGEGVLARDPTPDDIRLFLRHLFNRPVLFGSMEDEEGFFLLNPANAVRFTLAPAPQQTLAGSWPMEIVFP
jgi:hypothetical protein